MGNLFSSGISEDDCGTGDYSHMNWDGEACVHNYKGCGSTEVYDMSTGACRAPNSSETTVEYKACDSGKYYDGTSCVSFPTQTLDINTLKLAGSKVLQMNGCTGESAYYNFGAPSGTSSCIQCIDSDNQVLNATDPLNPFCECKDGYTSTQTDQGLKCVQNCAPNEAKDETGCLGTCEDGYTQFSNLEAPDGNTSNPFVPFKCEQIKNSDGFTNPVTGKKLTEQEKLMLIVLVLVVLYVYRRQVKAFVNKGGRMVRRR